MIGCDLGRLDFEVVSQSVSPLIMAIEGSNMEVAKARSKREARKEVEIESKSSLRAGFQSC